jgi:RND family efflux transporter MFP subunit
MSTERTGRPGTGTGVAAAVLGATLLATGCGGEPPASEPIRPVRVEPVVATEGSRTRTFAGTARAGLESRLSFKVPGTVQSLAVKVGDRVRSGQTIATLDPRDFRLQVEDAEAALQQARARARNSEAILERVRGLYENGNASQTDYDAARSEFDSASAQVDSLTKRVALAQSQLEYTRLRSPRDGAISEVAIEISENVQPGQAIATLTAGRRPEVEIAVPEAFIGRIEADREVSVRFDALPGRTFAAVVTEVGITSTGAATTYPVKVRLIDAGDGVRPGMAAEVAITFGTDGGGSAILAPPFAVGEDREGRFVFVAERTGEGRTARVRRRAVTVGDLTADGLAILDGLEEGDLLVTAGVSRLRDGMEVLLPADGETGR